MELQGLRLEIAVRPDSENNVADYLSRNPAAETDEETQKRLLRTRSSWRRDSRVA